MDLKTPLYETHVAAGGKVVPFAGYLLPIQYGTGIITEHMAVRKQAGLFDVSHMGEVIYSGPDATANVNKVITNDVTLLQNGDICYSPILNHEGGFVDDCIVYKMNEHKYFIVINASNRHKDVAWFKEQLFGNVVFEDVSDITAEVALQGPNSTEILKRLVAESDIPAGYYTFKENVLLDGIPCLISQTGYTGETGYEIYTANEHITHVWNKLLEVGADLGLIPCGLGARDTLRLEAGMPLYGHEMDDTVTPLEIGLGFFVKMEKDGGFVGKEALLAKQPFSTKRVGLKVTGKGIVREHATIYAGDEVVGTTTSGTHSPYFGYGIAMAHLNKKHAKIGTALEVDVRGRRISVEVIKLPFYKKAQ